MYDNCGELREDITLLLPVTGQDSQGNATHGWEVLTRTRAQVRDVGGREYYAAATTQSEKRKDIKIRWRFGMTEGMAVEYCGAIYEITDIDHLGNRRGGWMLLHTRRIKGEGETHGEI